MILNVLWPTQVRGVDGRSVMCQVSSTSSIDVLWWRLNIVMRTMSSTSFFAPSHTMRAARSCRGSAGRKTVPVGTLNTEQARIVFSVMQHHVPTHQSDPKCDRLTGDEALRQIRNSWIVQLGKWWEQEAVQVSSMLGQFPTSAEIEEVRWLSCGALDPEFDAEEDAACEMYSQSDL